MPPQINNYEVEIHHDSSSSHEQFIEDVLINILKRTAIRSWKLLPGTTIASQGETNFIADYKGTVCNRALFDQRLFQQDAFEVSKPVILFLLSARHISGPESIEIKDYTEHLKECLKKKSDRIIVILLEKPQETEEPSEIAVILKKSKVKCVGVCDNLETRLVSSITYQSWVPLPNFFKNKGMRFSDARKSFKSSTNKLEYGQASPDTEVKLPYASDDEANLHTCSIDEVDDSYADIIHRSASGSASPSFTSGYITKSPSNQPLLQGISPYLNVEETTLSDISSLDSCEEINTNIKTGLFQPITEPIVHNEMLTTPVQESVMDYCLTQTPTGIQGVQSVATEHEVLVDIVQQLKHVQLMQQTTICQNDENQETMQKILAKQDEVKTEVAAVNDNVQDLRNMRGNSKTTKLYPERRNASESEVGEENTNEKSLRNYVMYLQDKIGEFSCEFYDYQF